MQHCASPQTLQCHECAHHIDVPPLTHGEVAKCPVCNAHITQKLDNVEQQLIAYSVAGLLFLLFALPFKFLSFTARGQGQSIDILGGLEVLLNQEYLALAIIQLLAIIVLPAAIFICLLVILIPHQLGKQWRYSARACAWLERLIPWSMAEIFLVGVLISLIKMSELAEISIGMSFFAYIGFALCSTLTMIRLDQHHLRHIADYVPRPSKVSRSLSVQSTWAWLVTAMLLYVPANTLPIMNTLLLGDESPSTIMGGVILLWQHGSYPIAIIIFVASVVVPVAKLVILCWLNYSIQTQQFGQKLERTQLYRLTEFIGRWSMIDVFVVAILVSLVQLGNTMSIIPGPASLAFCAVVVFTMGAAMSFEPRFIWQRTDHTV